MGTLLEIGPRMRAARKRAHLSQKQLGEHVGLSTAQISRIEAGDNTSVRVLSRICDACGTTLEAVITGPIDPGLLERILALPEEKQRLLREMLEGLSRPNHPALNRRFGSGYAGCPVDEEGVYITAWPLKAA